MLRGIYLLVCALVAVNCANTDSALADRATRANPDNWWNRVTLFSDEQRRDLRADNQFWGARGKRSAEPIMEEEDFPEDEETSSQVQAFLTQIAFELLKEYPLDEITDDIILNKLHSLSMTHDDAKRSVMKPNSLFGAYFKRAGYKPNGLFQAISGKRSLKPNGLFGSIHGKRSIKPNGLFSIGGKRSLKPNGLFVVPGKRESMYTFGGKRTILLKPNGLFVPTKRIMKPNGLFSAFKRERLAQDPIQMFRSLALSPVEGEEEDQDREEHIVGAEGMDEPVLDFFHEFAPSKGTPKRAEEVGFWAQRGKREDSNGFWAQRGKRSSEDSQAVDISSLQTVDNES